MEIEAIYENGRVELPAHIRLKHQRIKVRLEVPDDALIAEKIPEERTWKVSDIRERIRNILGPDQEKLDAVIRSTDNTRDIWHEHLEEKYLERS